MNYNEFNTLYSRYASFHASPTGPYLIRTPRYYCATPETRLMILSAVELVCKETGYNYTDDN